MLDNTIYISINAPKAHQRVIGKIMTALGHLFYREGSIPYEPFTETMIDEGKTSPTPKCQPAPVPERILKNSSS
jgi:hypothetical protein